METHPKELEVLVKGNKIPMHAQEMLSEKIWGCLIEWTYSARLNLYTNSALQVSSPDSHRTTTKNSKNTQRQGEKPNENLGSNKNCIKILAICKWRSTDPYHPFWVSLGIWAISVSILFDIKEWMNVPVGEGQILKSPNRWESGPELVTMNKIQCHICLLITMSSTDCPFLSPHGK